MKSRQGACRDLRTEMVNTFDGSPISAFAYAYDAAGRRTERVDSGLTTNLFGYNMRSELADAIMGTNVYAYLYDPIGNRQWASANENTNLYQANELNQYTNINEGAVEPVYDLDGNLTQLGPWAYDWDGENRLIFVSSNGVPVVQNQYDYMSRRVMKATATQTNTFLYDGWNLIRESIGAATPTSRFYAWGLDLSGALQGAGGVGGLLMVVKGRANPPGEPHFPSYDANGNITDLVDTNGSVVAHYEYDPYGNTIAQSGDYADTNPFRFSSKYFDDETSLYYYGHRFYNPELGRFIARDPVGEDGGMNVYVFVENGPIRRIDPFGNAFWEYVPVSEYIYEWRCVEAQCWWIWRLLGSPWPAPQYICPGWTELGGQEVDFGWRLCPKNKRPVPRPDDWGRSETRGWASCIQWKTEITDYSYQIDWKKCCGKLKRSPRT